MPKNNEIKKSSKKKCFASKTLGDVSYNAKWYFNESFNLPNSGLRSYFDRVRMGQPEVYRAPFANKQDPQVVLKEWEPFVQSLSNKWPTLVKFEDDLRSKVGPMSVMKPLSERMDDIDHYYDDIHLPSRPISGSALKAVISEFKQVKGLRPRNQLRTVEIMKKSTNSGAPYFTKRRNVLKKTIYCTCSSQFSKQPYTMIGQNGSLSGKGMDYRTTCAILGWRGQEGGPLPSDVKQRVVWMFPFAVNIRELQVYQPLIESCQRFNLVPAWVSMESVDERITRMFDTKGKDDVVICTDFSKFDQHFNSDMQQGAQYVLEHLLTMTDYRSHKWIREVFPIKYNIPLAYGMNQVRFGNHGMGSGSGGTNADETLAHRALQYECALLNHQVLNPYSQCLGDDGVLTFPGISADKVMETYSSHGQEMNVDKQYVSKHDCVYLRRWHHDQYRQNGICVGVYSTYRALGRLMEQERYYDPDIWSEKMVALRQLSIIENVKYHPLREEFAQFCMKRDKFRLGLDIPGFLDHIDNYAREAIDLMPDFLGYTKSMIKDQTGLSDWWIVKYLKSQR